MRWLDNYIGVPYKELNCAELLAKILLKEFGRKDEAYALIVHNAQGTSPLSRRKLFEQHALDFCELVQEQDAAANDIVLLYSSAGFHMGMLVKAAPLATVLHTTEKTGCVSENFTNLKTRYTVVGFYRLKN
jgi:hypothetical protein